MGPDDVCQATAIRTVVKSFICPSDNGKGRNSYRALQRHELGLVVARAGAGPLTRPQPGGQSIGTIAGVTDGTSNTIAFFERLRGTGDGGAGQARQCVDRRAWLDLGHAARMSSPIRPITIS